MVVAGKMRAKDIEGFTAREGDDGQRCGCVEWRGCDKGVN